MPKKYKLLKSNGETYLSLHKASEVGTAHCPDCLKHFEDCECRRRDWAIKRGSKTKPDLDQMDKRRMNYEALNRKKG